MSALQPRDRVQILVGLHAGKPGTVHSLDGEGYWVLPDGVSTPALYEAYELAEEDDGTEAEAYAVVEVPRQHRAEPVGDLRPRWSQAGYASVRWSR
jgi:hypothetical protein